MSIMSLGLNFYGTNVRRETAETPETFMMRIVFLTLGYFLLLTREVKGTTEAWLESEKYAEVGTEVLLPCILKPPQCGALQSIDWYRAGTRIFAFSEGTGLMRSNDGVASSDDRLDIEYMLNSTTAYLKMIDVKLKDEGLYRCETVYSAGNLDCNNIQHVTLNVTIKPVNVHVIDENTKNILSPDATFGPIDEGSTISLTCQSGEGRPVPTVQWFKGDQQLEAVASSTIDANGIGTGSSSLKMQVTREELGDIFTCKVNSVALLEPITDDIKLDIHVRPLKMDLSGVVGHAVQGTKILLQCTVSSARPAANVTWYNGSEPLTISNEKYELFETKIFENNDSTSKTISYLAFTASAYENGKTFSCIAENPVIRTKRLKPMKEVITIKVLYPPIINMRPINITVNETDDFIIYCDYEANPITLTKVTWLQDDLELTLDEEHYEGGITVNTALIVKNATATDMGSYKCILENSVGSTSSKENVNVSVLYKPVVEVISDPGTPVNEEERLNVSLSCTVLSGNPEILTAVRWYLDGDLLKELPDCTMNYTITSTLTEESSSICDIDPSKLLLEAVGRSFHGDYSCEGRNEAGWGPMSPSTSVTIYYKPGPATISYEPKEVVKGQRLTIACSVLDPGRPIINSFKWFRDLYRLTDQTNSLLDIESADVKVAANFTCMASNDAGDGYPATTSIDVSVAPTFIQALENYQGFVYNSINVSLVCWIECVPDCNVSWYRNDQLIDFDTTDRYYLTNSYMPLDYERNYFASIQSNLTWNLTALANGRLDHTDDDAKFTCKSSDNGIGKPIESTTQFHVEFPPENMTISKKIINVTVDTIPETVSCDAKAYPNATFRWFREGSNDTIIKGQILDLNTPIPRRSNGTYYCEASNHHGKQNISLVVNVQFKPDCHIQRERLKDQDYISCSAIGNPEEINFIWSVENDNETIEPDFKIEDGISYVLLDTSITKFRTYVCIANNSIGQSTACELDITGDVPWWYRMDGNLLLIAIIVSIIIILAIIIVCVVILIICRRKRKQIKYSNENGNNNQANNMTETMADGTTKTFYENLPFHGIQAPPNKAFSPGFSDLDYADVDYRSYGPINYKAASIALFQKQQAIQRQQQQNQQEERRPQMYGISDDNEELL
ncbi:hemicentin-2-like [Vespa mandarinia]|uniref:hemicentin-2-like n=1 Tax=Vespa mandarinia TaxID=7446 RepID=UPI00162015BC|nr:hemicentin-2-like [Vespa mandarinia]XP_035734400.1 hemicentin-2-like [Vespa mandarinia]XP_035734401.1 hemicentin-2-like [Vespa mandarinia]XP_035734402.1 hemicentin-2-like [Vespa mandarinia]XP_035734403.1 hemicentin-2-like [Vespa mandarinia]XP_035734404.1 hemicentin-2-like [Vespa mandarinia]